MVLAGLEPFGESSSKLGPPEVVDPVREGDCNESSFNGEESCSTGIVTRDFSVPVTASDIARTPSPLGDVIPFPGCSQLGVCILSADLGESVRDAEDRLPSSFVTVGEVGSLVSGNGPTEEVEGVLR